MESSFNVATSLFRPFTVLMSSRLIILVSRLINPDDNDKSNKLREYLFKLFLTLPNFVVLLRRSFSSMSDIILFRSVFFRFFCIFASWQRLHINDDSYRIHISQRIISSSITLKMSLHDL